MQNAATLCPLWACSATSPRHFVHASALRCLIPQECGTLLPETRWGLTYRSRNFLSRTNKTAYPGFQTHSRQQLGLGREQDSLARLVGDEVPKELAFPIRCLRVRG
jgi:hypothetical protein